LLRGLHEKLRTRNRNDQSEARRRSHFKQATGARSLTSFCLSFPKRLLRSRKLCVLGTRVGGFRVVPGDCNLNIAEGLAWLRRQGGPRYGPHLGAALHIWIPTRWSQMSTQPPGVSVSRTPCLRSHASPSAMLRLQSQGQRESADSVRDTEFPGRSSLSGSSNRTR